MDEEVSMQEHGEPVTQEVMRLRDPILEEFLLYLEDDPSWILLPGEWEELEALYSSHKEDDGQIFLHPDSHARINATWLSMYLMPIIAENWPEIRSHIFSQAGTLNYYRELFEYTQRRFGVTKNFVERTLYALQVFLEKER